MMMLARLPSTLRDPLRCRKGTAAIEFAAVAPLLVLLLLGVMQFSLIFYTYSAAQQAGWFVARQVATGNLSVSASAGAARALLPGWAQQSASIPTASLSAGAYTVTITVPLAGASPVQILNPLLGSASLTTKASFLSEIN